MPSGIGGLTSTDDTDVRPTADGKTRVTVFGWMVQWVPHSANSQLLISPTTIEDSGRKKQR